MAFSATIVSEEDGEVEEDLRIASFQCNHSVSEEVGRVFER